MIVIVPLIIIAGLFLAKSARGSVQSNSAPTNPTDQPQVFRSNSWGLPDVDSSNDQSGFVKDYDESYEKASGATGVPFALLKAHGYRESKFDPNAYHYDNEASGSSYGLNQLEWKGDDRFSKYGYPDSNLGSDGSGLYDPETNAMISALIIKDNLGWLMKTKSLQGLRNTINAYNAGVPETIRAAPNNYTDDVLNAYAKIIGQPVTV